MHLFYGLLAGVAIGLAIAFRQHPSGLLHDTVAGEVAIGLCLLPIVSPLAWKAHFVTLFAGHWIVWRTGRPPWLIWWASFACLTLSAAALLGGRVSHVLESLNVITVGALLVFGMTLFTTLRPLRPLPPASSAPPYPP